MAYQENKKTQVQGRHIAFRREDAEVVDGFISMCLHDIRVEGSSGQLEKPQHVTDCWP